MREHAVGILDSTKMSINHSGRACIARDCHSMSMSMGIRGSLSAGLRSGLPMWRGILQGSGRQFRVIVGITSTVVGSTLSSDLADCAPARRSAPILAPVPNIQPARTSFGVITGDPSKHVEDRLFLAQDSPVVASLPFLEWEMDAGPPQIASAPMTEVVSTLFQATSRPTLLDQSALGDLPFISHKVKKSELDRWTQALDSASAFETIWPTFEAWQANASSFAPQANNPDHLALRADSFEETEPWGPPGNPDALQFLSRCTIADLLNADRHMPDESFQPHSLARAFLLAGSKDNAGERGDDSSTLRLAAETISGIIQKEMRSTDPSASGMAAKFVTMLRDVQLPPTFRMHAITSKQALREFELGYDYKHASATEAAAIEAELFLNVGTAYPIFNPILELFSSGPQAAHEFQRLTSQLLPAQLLSAVSSVKLPALAELFEGASWRALLTTNSNLDAANLTADSGSRLVSALIRSHTEITDSSAGPNATSLGEPGGSGTGTVTSYGSVREKSIGNALRLTEASEALAAAATQTGVERVETLMQSGSVILTRAELLQEAWLHNRNDTLAFCSLDEPSLCPYFASVLTEDPKTGTIPQRLASYTFPESALRTLRTCDWSQFDFIGEALRIRQLERGSVFLKPTARETYVVEKSLDLVRDLGSRLFFGLNLALAPQDGCSFAEGVDLQIKGVDFAMSLPKIEKDEWLTFMDDQFRTNWLTEGAKYYHSKLRSGRPDAPEAQLSEYLPLDNPFFNNVQARLKRADPVAEFRIAFPTMFASESIALAGTSASSSSTHTSAVVTDDKDKGKGKGKNKKNDDDKKRALPTGPGSKSKLAMPISPTELWISGVVFKTKEISDHYKITDDKCWPVLLTKKMGEEALSICPNHASHGDLKQAIHRRPNNFDLDHIYKKFTRAATADENKKADWKTPSKKNKI